MFSFCCYEPTDTPIYQILLVTSRRHRNGYHHWRPNSAIKNYLFNGVTEAMADVDIGRTIANKMGLLGNYLSIDNVRLLRLDRHRYFGMSYTQVCLIHIYIYYYLGSIVTIECRPLVDSNRRLYDFVFKHNNRALPPIVHRQQRPQPAPTRPAPSRARG